MLIDAAFFLQLLEDRDRISGRKHGETRRMEELFRIFHHPAGNFIPGKHTQSHDSGAVIVCRLNDDGVSQFFPSVIGSVLIDGFILILN